MKHGEPFTVGPKHLTMARASRCLALLPDFVGSTLSLPERIRETSAEPASSAAPEDGTSVGVVSIDGPLAQRGYEWLCGVVDGYDWITSRVSKALADPKVGALVLRIDSPGGDAAGLEEAVRRMRAAAEREGKRVIAFADEFAASAAYWIAAGVADEVIVPPTGEVGSIGCIGGWVDATKEAEMEGWDVHIVRDPPGKAAGHPYAPVADVADQRSLEVVQQFAQRFIDAIAARRGLEAAEVRGFDGAMFSGKAAVKAGLANKVGSFEDAINSAAAAARKRKKNMKETKALEALGLTEDATDEQIAAAAAHAKLGAHVLELTGATDAPTARGKLAAWKESHEQLPAVRERLEATEKGKAKGELSAFLLSQVGKKLTPAAAWAKDGDGRPIAGEPAERWTQMGLDEARAFCAELPEIGLIVENTKPVEAGGLNEHQIARAKAAGVDLHEFAQARASLRVVK